MIEGVRHRSSFDLLKRGRVARAGPLTVRYARTDRDTVEVAFALRRNRTTAVARNRCRRRLQAWLRTEARAGRVPPGVYLLAVRPDGLDLDYGELTKWADTALRALATPSRTGDR